MEHLVVDEVPDVRDIDQFRVDDHMFPAVHAYRQATDLEGFVLAHRFHARRTFSQQQRRLFVRHDLRMPIVAQELEDSAVVVVVVVLVRE
jgi:hypothetical protein